EQVEGRQLLSTLPEALPVQHAVPAVPTTFQMYDQIWRAGMLHHVETQGSHTILHSHGVVKTHGTHRLEVGHPGANTFATANGSVRPDADPTKLHVPPTPNFSSLPPYPPAQMKQAYGFDQVSYSFPVILLGKFVNITLPGDGSGQTIAIVDAYADQSI